MTAKLETIPRGAVTWGSQTNLNRLVGWDGKLAGITSACVPHYFAAGTWSIGTTLTGQTGNAEAAAMFVDSRGYVFVSVSAGGGIWRSTDGGATYTKVHSFTYTDEHALTFTEDDQGGLYSHGYNHATTSVQLLKSTDSGATWSSLTSAVVTSAGQTGGTVATLVNRHIHCVYFCPWRRWLFVTHGDAGSKSPILVSTDYGATFSAWGRFDTADNPTGSKQAAAIVTDDAYVYMAYDVGASVNDAAANFNIMRAAHVYAASLATLLAVTPSQVFDVEDYQGGVANTGFSIWADVNEYGCVMFTHGHTPIGGTGKGLLIASEDRGDTWDVLAETNGSGGIRQYAVSMAKASLYLPTRDRVFYGNSSDSTTPFGFRVWPSTRRVFGTADGTINHWLTHDDEISKISSDFESASGLSTEAGGSNTVDTASTTRAFSATKSMKLTLVGGSYCDGYKNSIFNDGDYAEGNEAIIESVIYIDAASITGNLVLQNFGGTIVFAIGLEATTRYIRCSLGGNGGVVKLGDASYAFPLSKWVRLRSVLRLHRTQGELTVSCDGVVVFRIVGIVSTVGDGTAAVRHASWAADSTQTMNVYHDDVYAGVLPAASVVERIESGMFAVPGDVVRINQVQPLALGHLVLADPAVVG